MKYLRLNSQYAVRNEKNCSYIIKRHQQIDKEIDNLTPGITMIPPFIGYILSEIGKNYKEVSILKIAKNLGVQDSSLKLFLDKITNTNAKKIVVNGSNVILPKNLLVFSNNIDENFYITSADFKYSQHFDTKRPSIPLNVTFMVTTKCTTDCIYCYAKRNFKKELSLTEIISTMRECHDIGVVNLGITGGDIFAYPHWRVIVEKAMQFGYHPFISTKTPITKEDVTFLKDTGITDLQFSIDSLSLETLRYMVKSPKNYLDKLKEMFKACQELDIKLDVRSVIINKNGNLYNFKELYAFLIQFNNIKSWAITPAFYSEFKEKYKYIQPDNIQLSTISKYITSLGSSFPIYLNKINQCGYTLRNFSTVEDFVKCNQICHANSFMMAILANGQCTPCEMLYDNPEFSLGNIKESQIFNIWNSSKALKLFKPQQAMVCNASPCSTCKVYTKCRSSIDRRVCFVDIAKTLGVGKGEFPDPRCPESVEMDVIL